MARLLHRLERGEFTVTVELDPPKGAEVTRTLARVRRFADRVDAVNVTDCPLANVRMGAIALAHLLQRDLPVETIIHFTTRDRNVIGLQSELLSAAALGIRNVLCLKGDPPHLGDHPTSRPVFELDTVQLLSLVKTLNQGNTLSGRALEARTDFAVACAANPCADDLDVEISKLEAKIEAGAHFAQTQPIFDPALLERWLNKINGRIKFPILYGVLPVKSYEFAQGLNKIPGMKVPTWLLDRMHGADEATGQKIAAELVQEISTWGITGLHIFPMQSSARVNGVLDALAEIGLRPPSGVPEAKEESA